MRLSDGDIKDYLDKKIIQISPVPEKITGVGADLSLGNRFRVFTNNNVPYIDLSGSKAEVDAMIEKAVGPEVVIGEEERLFLHPGELALGVTKETVTIPDNIVGWLDGRSSLARLGLMVHVTAHRIDPGWSGVIVLEFFNAGKIPLALKPGMSICAINFETMTKPALMPYNKKQDAKYKKQLGPIPSRIGNEDN